LADAKTAMENQSADVSTLNSARERLTQASHKLAEVMYKAAQTAPGGPGGPGESAGGPPPDSGEKKKDEGVIDAEYVDVDEKK
jgi:molecular chaperone DnaK